MLFLVVVFYHVSRKISSNEFYSIVCLLSLGIYGYEEIIRRPIQWFSRKLWSTFVKMLFQLLASWLLNLWL
jgi:hypothetical protein